MAYKENRKYCSYLPESVCPELSDSIVYKEQMGVILTDEDGRGTQAVYRKQQNKKPQNPRLQDEKELFKLPADFTLLNLENLIYSDTGAPYELKEFYKN